MNLHPQVVQLLERAAKSPLPPYYEVPAYVARRIYRDTPDGPRAVRSIGTVIDITHLKETEAALRDSELRLRLALEAAQMGTFEADMNGRRALIDAQEARLLGLPADTRVVTAEELRKRIEYVEY